MLCPDETLQTMSRMWRLAIVGGACGLAWLTGFYTGSWILSVVAGWAQSLDRYAVGHDLLLWLRDRGPVDVAFTFGGLVIAGATRWALRAPAPDRPSLTFGVIPRQAKWFQARPKEQRELEKALGGKDRAALVALPGARGAGKTQLAAAYARRRARFDLVAWINAENGLVAELALLGDRLGVRTSPEQPAEEVAALAIARVPTRSLLIFDNVNDPDAVVRYLPATGKVLITTNRREFVTMPDIAVVDVGMFTPPQGRALLTAATGQSDDTFELGELLGWLPLGMAQAAAYITLNNITCREYIHRLNRTEVDEALIRQAGAQHIGVVQATRLSLEAVDPAARQLLAVISMLAPEGVRRALLTRPEVLAPLGMSLGEVERALAALTNTSLVTQSGVDEPVMVTLHRLTAKIVRHDIDAAETVADILGALTEGLPEHQASIRRGELEELIAHILAARSNTEHFVPELHSLVRWAGNNLREVGDASRAISFHEAMAAESSQALGDDDLSTLVDRNELARSYFAAGGYREAVSLHERNLADYERILGPDHPHTFISRNNLADAYSSAGRLEDAIRLHEQNHTDRERILGPDHPHIFVGRNNLAEAYLSAGRLEDATRLHEQNLADRERILGPDHPGTATSRNNLAASYWSAGRYEDAIRLFEQNLADVERLLGSDHPSTATGRNNIAAVYRAAGRLEDSIRLHEQNLTNRERILGPDHPDTLGTRNNLAISYWSANRHEDAIRLIEQNLADFERLLGPDHPDTVLSRENLAECYRSVGRHGDADRLLQRH